MNGAMLKQLSVTNIHRIDIRELPIGVYFVQVVSGVSNKTFRLIKN